VDPQREEPIITTELFHLGRDPGENYNVAERHPDIVSRLYARMQSMAAELDAEIVPIQ
jgi:hypothetical protein